MLNLNKHTKTKPKPKNQQLTVRTAHTAQTCSDNFPSYPP